MYASRPVWRTFSVVLLLFSFLLGVAEAQSLVDRVYKLGVGDRLRVIVLGEGDLSGEFEIGSKGTINLPLIGEVDAEGLTISELEDNIEARLADGYLRAPNVTMEVTNYRPFYILGEVQGPGSYPYVNGMTVLNAVALAGGFTYRAREGEVLLSRDGSGTDLTVPVTTQILPGDIITVRERFF